MLNKNEPIIHYNKFYLIKKNMDGQSNLHLLIITFLSNLHEYLNKSGQKQMTKYIEHRNY